MKSSLKEWLYFRPKERKVALLIVVIVGAIFLVPKFSKKDNDKALPVAIHSDSVISQNQQVATQFHVKPDLDTSVIQLHIFDPNEILEEDLLTLGVSKQTAAIWIKYRSNGGQFRQASDIRKVFTLRPELANQLIPYVRIHNVAIPSFSTQSKQYVSVKKSGQYANVFPKKKMHTIDINSATEADWASMPGIGDVLSKRIIKFRKYKKGFQAIDDVSQTYGLSSETYQKIKPYLRLENEYVER